LIYVLESKIALFYKQNENINLSNTTKNNHKNEEFQEIFILFSILTTTKENIQAFAGHRRNT